MQSVWFHQFEQFLPKQVLRHWLVVLELQKKLSLTRYFQADSKTNLCIDIGQRNFSMKALLFEAFSQWKLVGLMLQWNMTTRFLRNLRGNLLLKVFAGVWCRNPSPLTPCTSICRSSKPSACSISRWFDMAGNLQLAVGQTCTRNCAKQIYTWSLLSGKHSGVAISGYRYMRDSVANQSLPTCAFSAYIILHPTFYPSKLAFGEWRDGSWWFLIVPDHLDTTRDCKGWIWITWSRGDSWSKSRLQSKNIPLCSGVLN